MRRATAARRVRHSVTAALASLVPALAGSQSATAAPVYWDGTGTIWNEAGSWSTDAGATAPDQAPTADDVATFNTTAENANPAGATLNDAGAAQGIAVNTTGAVTIQGDGTDRILSLGASGITLNAGAGPLTIGSPTAGQGVSLSLQGGQTWNNNAGTASASAVTIHNAVSLGVAGPATLTLGGNTPAATINTVNGSISDGSGGPLSITKSGAGLWTLAGVNNYTGSMDVNAGVLRITNKDALGTVAGGTNVAATAQLVLNTVVMDRAEPLSIGNSNNSNALVNEAGASTWAGTITANTTTANIRLAATGGSLTINGDINVTGNNLLVFQTGPANGSANITVNGAITSAVGSTPGMTKSSTGNGRLTYAGTTPNTYAGTTTVSTGTLELNKTAGVTAVPGNLVITGTSSSPIVGATVLFTKNNQIADTADVTVNHAQARLWFHSNVSPNAATETIRNLTFSNGELRTAIGTPSAGNYGLVTITDTLRITGGNFALNSGSSMSANKVILNGGTNVIGGGTTNHNTLTVGSGGMEITGGVMPINGAAAGSSGGRILLNGDVSTFASTIEAGFHGGSAGVVPPEVNLGSTATRTFTIADGDAARDMRIQYAVTGTGGLTKAGPGVLSLEGVNTYAGTTAVNAGTLLVSGSIAGAASVTSGTLGGTGTVGGNVSVSGTGTIAPGASPGALSLGGSLDLGAGSTLAIELNGAVPVTGYDQLNLTNAAATSTLDPSALLSLSVDASFTPTGTEVFYILNRADAGGFSTLFAGTTEGGLVNLAGGYQGQITYQANWTGTQGSSTLEGGNDVAIYNVVVPEPGAAGVLLLAAGGLAARRSGRARRR